MKTTTPLLPETLIAYSETLPKEARVILRHEDGRIFSATEFKRGAKLWYPDGRVTVMQGIFDSLELVGVRRGDVFVNSANATETPTAKSTNSRASRMMKAQETLTKVTKPEPMTFQELGRKAAAEIPEPRRCEMTVVKAREGGDIKFDPTAPLRTEDEDDFVSVSDLQSEIHTRRGELFLSLRCSGQIVFPSALREVIGKSNFDIRISRKQRVILVEVGPGKLTLTKTGKMSCHALIKMIHEVQGLQTPVMKTAIGRVNLTEVASGLYSASF